MAPIPINKIAKPNEVPRTIFCALVTPISETAILVSLGIAKKETTKISVNKEEAPKKAAT